MSFIQDSNSGYIIHDSFYLLNEFILKLNV